MAKRIDGATSTGNCVNCGASLHDGHMDRLNPADTTDFPYVGPHERVRFTCPQCGRPQTRLVPVSVAEQVARKQREARG